MARINLLPWREERRRQQRRDFFAMLGAGAVLAVLVVVAAHLQIQQRIEYQQARNALLRKELTRLQVAARQIKELDKVRAALLSRYEVIRQLQAARPEMVRLLDALPRLLPEDVYLTAMQRKEGLITLSGVARDNTLVSDLMRRLAESPWFGEPRLKLIENKDINNVRASFFELEIRRAGEDGGEGG